MQFLLCHLFPSFMSEFLILYVCCISSYLKDARTSRIAAQSLECGHVVVGGAIACFCLESLHLNLGRLDR